MKEVSRGCPTSTAATVRWWTSFSSRSRGRLNRSPVRALTKKSSVVFPDNFNHKQTYKLTCTDITVEATITMFLNKWFSKFYRLHFKLNKGCLILVGLTFGTNFIWKVGSQIKSLFISPTGPPNRPVLFCMLSSVLRRLSALSSVTLQQTVDWF